MLQQVRDRVQGWIASIVIGLVAITFALWGIGSYLGGGAGPGKIAKVNGKLITETDLNAAYERLRQSLQNQSSAPLALDESAQTVLKQQALKQLISAQVLSDAARKAGYVITPAQVDNAIMQIPGFQEKGQFSPARFQQVLEILGYSQDRFLIDLEKTLLASQAQLGIQNSAFGLPNEAKSVLMLFDQKRDVSYTTIPASQFLKSTQISDVAINNYYQQHQDQFQTPEKVSIQYLELSVAELEKNIQISPAELQQYYENNIAAFTKDNKTQPFSQVEGDVKKALTQQKLQQAFSDKSQQLTDLTYTNSTSLSAAADALNLPIQATGQFTRAGDKTGLTANPKIIAAAFNPDVLKNGNNSSPIPIKDGDVVVLRVKDYQPAAVQPLAVVKNQIEHILQTQAAQEAAKMTGQKILAELEKDGNKELIAKQNGFAWQVKNAINRQAAGVNTEVLQAAFSMPRPIDKTKFSGISLNNGDYAIIAVNKVVDDTAQPATQQIQVTQNEIENNYGQLDYELYINQLMKDASIKLYSPAKSNS